MKSCCLELGRMSCNWNCYTMMVNLPCDQDEQQVVLDATPQPLLSSRGASVALEAVLPTQPS